MKREWNKQEIEFILGPPSMMTQFGYVETHRYRISDKISLILNYTRYTFAVDIEQRLLSITWIEDDLRPQFVYHGLKLEEIIKDLPDKWQEIVLFNIDLFKHEGYLPTSYVKPKNYVKSV